jgi:rare lipoprotein A
MLASLAEAQGAGAFEATRSALQTGFATYYSSKFDGRRSASGVTFRNDALMAAHPSLPFGTLARVTCLLTGASVVVRVIDRGPAIGPINRGVIIDLSQRAARQLGMIDKGRLRVVVEALVPSARAASAGRRDPPLMLRLDTALSTILCQECSEPNESAQAPQVALSEP